jgi:hypothetical protein
MPSEATGLRLKAQKVQYVKMPMTASLLRTSGSHTDAQMKAMGQIYQSLQQQASILSYIDVLQTLATFCACMVPLVLLMKRPPKGTTVARPLITHVSPQETNKCASSQTLPQRLLAYSL